MRRLLRTLVPVLAFAGCGGSAPPPQAVAAEEPPAPEVQVERGVIRRAELDVVIDQGLGAFLSRVGTEPDVRGGSFVGFRVTELRDAALFDGVDLAPGDTLVAVNGRPIERPEQALEAFGSLRVASELALEVLRGDERRELRFSIVD